MALIGAIVMADTAWARSFLPRPMPDKALPLP
jgi:hypothetical protein